MLLELVTIIKGLLVTMATTATMAIVVVVVLAVVITTKKNVSHNAVFSVKYFCFDFISRVNFYLKWTNQHSSFFVLISAENLTGFSE